MRIAVALDMPTSYNYLVKFDKNKYPQILKNFQSESSVEKVRDIGAVSLDFLQVVELDREIEEEVNAEETAAETAEVENTEETAVETAEDVMTEEITEEVSEEVSEETEE